eukprot:363521-Chlamydomonas_euryale.AAC.5
MPARICCTKRAEFRACSSVGYAASMLDGRASYSRPMTSARRPGAAGHYAPSLRCRVRYPLDRPPPSAPSSEFSALCTAHVSTRRGAAHGRTQMEGDVAAVMIRGPGSQPRTLAFDKGVAGFCARAASQCESPPRTPFAASASRAGDPASTTACATQRLLKFNP